MKLYKRVVSVLLSLCILGTSLPVFPAHAAESVQIISEEPKNDPIKNTVQPIADDPGDSTTAYDLSGLTVGKDSRSVTVQVVSPTASVLFIGLYDQDGSAMFHSARADVNGSSVSQEIEVDIDPAGHEDFTVKAFLLDPTTYACLCTQQAVHYVKWMELDGFAAPAAKDISYSEEEYIHYINNTLLVFFKEDASTADIEAVASSIDGKIIGHKSDLRLFQFLIESSSLDALDALAAAVMGNDCVTYASYDQYMPNMTADVTAVVPNDPWNGDVSSYDWKDHYASGSNWWLEAIDAQFAWAYADEFSPIKIGITDGSFDITHDDLKNKVSFASARAEALNTPVAGKAYEHGTHVAGIIVAEHDNGIGISGTVPNAELLLAPIPHCTSSELICGLNDLVAAGAKVINMSVGESEALASGQSYSSEQLEKFARMAAVPMAILLEDGADFIVVMSAGNGNKWLTPMDAMQNGWFCSLTNDTPTYSDSISINDIRDRVIVVGSAMRNGDDYALSPFSNYGAQIDICAPGSNVYSTLPHTDGNTGTYGEKSGTSMATPIVTGICAMVWSARPELTAPDVRHLVCGSINEEIMIGASYNHPQNVSYPLVNAQKAVEAALKYTADTVPVLVNVQHEDGTPAAGVPVKAYGVDGTSLTNTDGTAVLFLEKGAHFISVNPDGWYADKTVEIKRRTTVNLTLKETFFELSLDETGDVLLINGYGPMPDYNPQNPSPFGSGANSVRINGVSTVGAYAFYLKDSLTEVTLSDSVKIIEDYAFSSSGLSSVSFPDDLFAIGQSAFSYNSSLSSLELPDSISKIGDSAFLSCRNLTTVNIPKNLAKLGAWAFSGCEKLASAIIIPEGVTAINASTFYECSMLPSIKIPSTVKEIGDSAFYCCSNLTSVVIPNGVKTIGNYAFAYCYYYNYGMPTGLSTVVLPDSVTSIGDYAFEGCWALTSVTFGKGLREIGDHAFDACGFLSIVLPTGIETLGQGVFNNCENLTYVTLPNQITEISDWLFRNCYSLKSVTIPYGVETIGEWAFYDCKSLTSVSIPSTVTRIDSQAFTRCVALPSVTIPNSVETLADGAFSSCYSLSSIIIPGSVTQLGSAFSYCTGLSDVTILNGLSTIPVFAFLGCSQLTSITIPVSVTSIESSAFRDCDSLSKIYYAGTEAQWNTISISSSYNTPLFVATVTYLGK